MGGRLWTALSLALFLLGAAGLIAVATTRHRTDSIGYLILCLPAVLLGLLVVQRRPDSPSGPALILLGATPTATEVVEIWGQTYTSSDPWPGAHIAAVGQPGIWVFNLAGFVLLCLIFPDGLLPGRWRRLPWAFLAAAVLLDAAISLDPDSFTARHETPPIPLTNPIWLAIIAASAAMLLTIIALSVRALVIRHRRGDELIRLQLRWLVVGAGSVPVLLAAGWAAELAHVPVGIAYAGFLVAMLVFVPAAVTIAILRHDLLDVDRLLSESVAWVLTTFVAAGIFAAIVVGGSRLGGESGIGVAGAAFVIALLLLPVHRLLHDAVGRIFDRERTVMLARMAEFVRQVRDWQAEPEQVEAVLRDCLDDPQIRILLKLRDSAGYADLSGRPAEIELPDNAIPLNSGESEVGVIVLGRTSTRRMRRARAVAVEARLPIEVSRLRIELRAALADSRASRARLIDAATVERRRLERDLHDGAQQRLLAIGMRLRSIQRRHAVDEMTHHELDKAVLALEETVAELRRLAHGIRPSQLDDGLEAAIRSLVRDSPIPVDITIGDMDVTESVATTAYFVVAEGLANTLKHADAANVRITIVGRGRGLAVEFCDDGRGGARSGFGLSALQDRVAALGGRIEIASPVGAGTTIRAEL